jgi:hypothetical protein
LAAPCLFSPFALTDPAAASPTRAPIFKQAAIRAHVFEEQLGRAPTAADKNFY